MGNNEANKKPLDSMHFSALSLWIFIFQSADDSGEGVE